MLRRGRSFYFRPAERFNGSVLADFPKLMPISGHNGGNFLFLMRLRLLKLLAAFSLLFGMTQGQAQSTNNIVLQLLSPNAHGWTRINAPGQEDRVYSLFASTNLLQWTPIATMHDGIFGFSDPATPLYSRRFYRATSAAKSPSDDWKNQARFPIDPFLSNGGVITGQELRWIKFTIVLNDPTRVYYQDSDEYEFHYDFAAARLEPYRKLTPAQFDQIALYTNRQELLLGTLLFPPPPHSSEYAIQFVGMDPYPAEFVERYFELVKSTVATESGANAFYLPAYEQLQAAEASKEYLQSKGIRLASAERWVTGNYAYSTGWALGQLKYIPGAEIDAAFADGRLRPQDILLTDVVPAEIPILAGVITLTPSTPNSHEAILSRSYGLPFAYIADEAEQVRVRQLAGKEILLRVEPYDGDVKVIEIEASLDPALRAEILGLKAPPKLEITPKAKFGAISASTDNLTPADIKYFGGKASNFGFLRREIPNRSHPAIALSFDLWDAFLGQVMVNGQTLRAQISQRLSKYSYPPMDMGAVKRDLEAIREMITDSARFTDAQKEQVITALRVFDPLRNIRFRSSTNVEDSEQFSGAGLYDSYSGCLQDDLDNDTAGPCLCDPVEAKERGVFRAIQKVYASFYNDNAFLERLRHNVDENAVGMAILVHHSTPDEIELANGVATLRAVRGGEFDELTGELVTQKGAVSVTNPDSNARPEVISGYHHAFGVGGFLNQRSSLVPLGAYVMDWQTNYVELMNLFAKVADAYHKYFPNKKNFVLDFEYKKVAPGVLDIKQVREVPVNSSTNLLPTFLLNNTNDYVVLQGEAGDVFSVHRLKSFWGFQTKNLKLSKDNLRETFYTNVDFRYLEGKEVKRYSGPMTSLPNFRHTSEDNTLTETWTLGSGAQSLEYTLETAIKQEVMPNEAPVLSLKDFYIHLHVNFATGLPALEYDVDGYKQVVKHRHTVRLEPRRTQTSTNYLQNRTFTAAGVNIQTSFYWPKPPGRGIDEKTAPLIRWVETRIEGLTSQPIILQGDYSQSYRPGHHNFSEEFIFEPSLESGLSPAQLQELQAANVQLIHVLWNGPSAWNGNTSVVNILGTDGKFRTLKQ